MQSPPALPSRQWQPRQWAQALTRLPPECRALGLRRVPRRWRALVHYLVWVYVPTLRRLLARGRAAMPDPILAYRLSERSRARLVGVHPDLVRVVERAIEITGQDFMVIEGLRTPERQAELYAQGRARPGPVVTWTLNSRHFAQTDGYGHAVDLVPWPVDWTDPAKFDAVADAMFAAAADLGVGLRWGADWDRDGNPRERGETDSPHFEIAP